MGEYRGLGAALGLFGYDLNLLNELLTGFFSGESGSKNIKRQCRYQTALRFEARRKN